MVYFLEEKHEYFNVYGDKYISVSGLMHEYINDFNKVLRSEIRALRDIDESIYKRATNKYNWADPKILEEIISFVQPGLYEVIKKDAADLRVKWEQKGMERSEYGTKQHSNKELEDELRGYKINPIDGLKYKVIPRQSGIGYDNSFYIDKVLSMKENICLLEGLLVDHDAMLAGQEDIIFMKYLGAGKFGAYNLDYKTDEEIDFKPFFNNGYQTMKNIMNPFFDCSYYHYSMKQSIYALMLEKMGIRVFGNYLQHIPENRPEKYIQTPYYKKYAEIILEKRISSL